MDGFELIKKTNKQKNTAAKQTLSSKKPLPCKPDHNTFCLARD